MTLLNSLRFVAAAVVLTISTTINAADGPPVARPARGAPPIPTRLFSPNETVVAAANDCSAINSDAQCHTRYLSLYNLSARDRIRYIQTLNYVTNSLSRSRLIKHIYVVPGTENTLLRLDITNYRFYDDVGKSVGWETKTWDKLGELDATFIGIKIKVDQEIIVEKIKRTKQVPTGRKIYVQNGYGSYYLQDEHVTETYYEDVTKPGQATQERIRDVPDWIDPRAYSALQTMTQSRYPIVRGDFFAATASLPPFYHDFLGFGTKVDDFLAAAVLTKDDIRRAQLEIKGVVVKSGAGLSGRVIPVANNNRFISRTQGPYGYVWRSKDVLKVKELNDYLRTLNDNDFDASEWITTGRNGLQWYFLSDNKDVRQDEAPIGIVRDDTNKDRRVRNGRSCFTCHMRGINEFYPLPQELVKHAIDIITPDIKKNKQLQETFISNLDEFITDDNKIYAKSIKAATTVYIGSDTYYLEPETNASQFGALYNAYAEDGITLERASLECGVPVKDLMVIFAAAKNDPFLLGLARNNQLFSVPRVHWDSSFQQAMLLVTEFRGRR